MGLFCKELNINVVENVAGGNQTPMQDSLDTKLNSNLALLARLRMKEKYPEGAVQEKLWRHMAGKTTTQHRVDTDRDLNTRQITRDREQVEIQR